MGGKRSFYVLVAVTIVVVAAAVFSRRPGHESSPSYGLQIPELPSQVDAVHAVVIRTADGSMRLERTAEGWVAASKDGYPADASRIRHLVLGLSRLQRLEKKTSDPERLAELELTDVDRSGSRATEIALLADDDRKLADLLVGKTQDFEASSESRYFVRNAREPQSWLVEGTLPPVVGDLSDWLEQKLLAGIGKSDIQSISVVRSGSKTITVQRESADLTDFHLAGLAEDEKIDNQYSLNAIPATFQRLSLKDVKNAASMKNDTVLFTVEAVTFSGVRITARFGRLEPDYSVRLSASYDPALAAGGETKAQAGGDGQDGGKDAGKDRGPDGEQLARELNLRWQNRYFVVSQYALDALMVKRADLLKGPENTSGSQ